MPKISIIVPVYKVEKYLERCLNSIIAQTFTDWECILIDDGSPDNSGKICDEYAKKDERFVVIHQENAGSAEARNQGLKRCIGKYIVCVDSDDWLEKNYLEMLYMQAEKEQADVVGCNLIREYENKSIIEKNQMPNTPEKCISSILNRSLKSWLHVKLIRRKVLVDNNVDFIKNINFWEDMIFSVKLFTFAKKVSNVDMELYHYSFNRNSLVNTFNEKRFYDSICAVDEIKSFLDNKGMLSTYKNELLILKASVKLEVLCEGNLSIQKQNRMLFPECDIIILNNNSIPVLKRLVVKLILGKHFFFGNLILALIKIRRYFVKLFY